MDERSKRLQALLEVPPIARMDHRFFLDEKGKDVRVESLSRKERRKIKAGGRQVAKSYVSVLQSISKSGAGYEADKLLRQLSIEYTNRYASSGLYNQPMSFNYFEPFCDIRLIDRTYAPYALPAQEIDNLFGLADYIDFITDPNSPPFDPAVLWGMESGIVHHYNVAGSILDFSFLSPAGNEFVISSFSLVRRAGSIHWYIVAGEILSQEEWDKEVAAGSETRTDDGITPHKALFLADVAKEMGNTAGPPMNLSGAKNAKRTIACGEIDIKSMRHIGRCLSVEHENVFTSASDDPTMFSHIEDRYERLNRYFNMNNQISQASTVWALAESFLRIPQYFMHRLAVPKSSAMAGRGRKPLLAPKATNGNGEKFRYVPSIALVDDEIAVREIKTPYYEVEKGGYWRPLDRGKFGQNQHGELVQGKTWVTENIDWRSRSDAEKIIYIKSSVAQARIKRDEFLSNVPQEPKSDGTLEGVVYVLRCLTMKDEIYKVGWTSGTAEDRAREISSATGVPTSFAVVESRHHPSPAALEAGVHARLAPYRLNNQREFFQVPYGVIREIIDQEIERAK